MNGIHEVRNRNFQVLVFCVGLSVLSGCGGDWLPKEEPVPPTVEASLQTQERDIYLPEDVQLSRFSEGSDSQGAYLFAEIEPNRALETGEFLRGVLIERQGTESENTLMALQALITTLVQSEGVNLSNVTTTLDEQRGVAQAQYLLNLTDQKMPTDLINQLIQILYPDLQAQAELLQNEALYNQYRLFLSVYQGQLESNLVSILLVPEILSGQFVQKISSIVSADNVASTGTVVRSDAIENFTAGNVSSSAADFLFVIDNSGSMADKQLAISQAAESFSNEISATGLDFQLGVITTDNDSLRNPNGFTGNVDEFKTDIVAGTLGSGVETGIYFAERALQSQVLGDELDGTVTLSGFPRQGASLSVVIISDEASQYVSRAGSIFDSSNNLFVDRAYTVHSIIDPNSNSISQYDDLAFATGGSVADIRDTEAFNAIMVQIANNSSSSAVPYVLSQSAIPSRITVTVNGVAVPSGPEGWQYFGDQRSIVFRGQSIPAPGESIQVSYSYISNR